jgi:hypothetical protein
MPNKDQKNPGHMEPDRQKQSGTPNPGGDFDRDRDKGRVGQQQGEDREKEPGVSEEDRITQNNPAQGDKAVKQPR